MFDSVNWVWWLTVYYSGLFSALLLLLCIALYDQNKRVPLPFIVIVTAFWPIAYPFFILISFTRFNRPPNAKQ